MTSLLQGTGSYNLTAANTQVGLALDGSTFKNFASSLGSMQSSSGTYPFPSVLNADQYPVGTIGDGIFGSALIPSNANTSTTYVLAWTGAATNSGASAWAMQWGAVVSVGGSFVIGSSAFNLSMAGTNGYIEFQFNTTPPSLIAISFANGATFTGFGGIIFCAKSDYQSVLNATNGGQLITSALVSSLKALAPRTIRFLGYNDVNDSNCETLHKYRLNWKTAFTFGNQHWIPTCWSGSSSGTNTYTCANATDSPTSYTAGEVIQLQFINASTSTPITIARGALTAVPLYNMFGSALGSGDIAANALATLIYDDLLGAYLVNFGGYGGDVCIPVEIQIGLCNQVGCNLWYNYPPHINYKTTSLEATTSVAQIAALASSTLNHGCYFEYANEVWNFGGAGFPQTFWAGACGVAFGFTTGSFENIYGYYGYRLATMWPQVVTAWGSKPGLKCVNAFQAYGPNGTGGATNVFRLQGSDLASVANGGAGNATWISYTGNANFRVSPNRPVDVCDTLSYATYYEGAQCQGFDSNYAPTAATLAATPNALPLTNITGITKSTTGNPGVLSYASDPAYATGYRVNLQSIGGMTQLNAMNVTLVRLTATTYSMYTDATRATPVDTSTFTAYTSGGTSGLYAQINGLTSWADMFADGTTVNVGNAIAALDNDIRQGLNNTALGPNTLLALKGGSGAPNSGVGIYPSWETIAASYDGARPSGKANLTIECYEGSMECIYPSTTSCTALGVSTAYGGQTGKIANLINAYKNSSAFYSTVLQQYRDFAAASATSGRFVTPSWFLVTSGDQWSMYPGDVYVTPPYQSYGATAIY